MYKTTTRLKSKSLKMDVYHGEEGLTLAMDLGATQSGCSVVHLHNGAVPHVRVVSRWPGSLTSSKIPTAIFYDANHTAQALGAETQDETVLDRAAESGWELAQYFKIRLHPHSMAPPSYQDAIQGDSNSRRDGAMINAPTTGQIAVHPLPFDVPVLQCYSDFIRYLFKGTEDWFKSNYPDGEAIWNKLSRKIKLVLAHPNGWTLSSQGFLKEAVQKSGVMDALGSESRLIMVTEGEASVHFALFHTANEGSQWLSPGSSFVVCDAGGSTTDICTYKVQAQNPKLKLREVKASDCTQSGGIFVTDAGRIVIEEKLGTSRYAEREYLEEIVKVFDVKAKLDVSGSEKPCIIRFGLDRDSDPSVGISRGRLTLTGDEIRRAFEPCISTIISSLESQIQGTNASSIILVGGFSESPYLQKRIRERFEHEGLKIVTVNEATKKAVAEGAGLFYCQESVIARAVRFSFGTAKLVPADEHPEQAGIRSLVVRPNGAERYDDRWRQIVARGEVVDAHQSRVSRKHHRQYKLGPDGTFDFIARELREFSSSLYAFRCPDGSEKSVTQFYDGWCRDFSGNWYPGFEKVCSIQADLSKLAESFPIYTNPKTGKKYTEVYFDICLMFGKTSLSAYIKWVEDGVEKTGPASIVPSKYHFTSS